MNPNNGESSKYGSGNKGSVIPKEKEHVSTKMGKQIAKYGEKAVASAVGAVKTHKNKGKINPQE